MITPGLLAFVTKWITLDKNEMVRIRQSLRKGGIFIQSFNKSLLYFYYVMIQQNTKLIKACPHTTYIIGVEDSHIYYLQILICRSYLVKKNFSNV